MVDFINILRGNFSYESALRSFSLITFWLCYFFGAKILAPKSRVKCWWNWHLVFKNKSSNWTSFDGRFGPGRACNDHAVINQSLLLSNRGFKQYLEQFKIDITYWEKHYSIKHWFRLKALFFRLQLDDRICPIYWKPFAYLIVKQLAGFF